MRKLFLMIIASAVIFASCSKEEQKSVEKTGIITHFTVTGDDVAPFIQGFNQRFENHKQGLKSGGDLPLGEALWSVEAGVNYEFRAEKEYVENIQNAEFTTTIPVTLDENNEYIVSESDVFDMYAQLLDFADANVEDEDVLIVSDVSVVSVENGNANMKMSTTSGSKKPNLFVINDTDYWYPVQDDGKCGPYAGQYAGEKDGSDRIREILNAMQMSGYWTDVETFSWIYNYSLPNGNSCFWGGYRDECLDPTAMQYWLDGAEYVVADLQPEGKHRIEANFQWDLIPGGSPTWYVHFFQEITYGIPNGAGSIED